MEDLEQPQLWYVKRHIETGVVFEEPISERMCKGWDSVPLKECMKVALNRLSVLNEHLEGKWEYAILGWRCGEVIEVKLW